MFKTTAAAKYIKKILKQDVMVIITQIICTILIFFYLWFYILFLLNDTCFIVIETFLLLFLGMPLISGLVIYYVFRMGLQIPIQYMYAFTIGFVIQWILFLNANPYPLENGNKYQIMKYIPEEFKPTQEFMLEEYEDRMEELKYPIVLKPIVCSGGSKDMYFVESYSEYIALLEEMKKQKQSLEDYMFQEYVSDYDVEITVLYERKPWEKKGEVIEIVEKLQKNKFRKFVDGKIKNRPELITEQVQEIFDSISQKIPGFYTGRYDIRLQKLEDLETGKMKILEVNGTMGMYMEYDSTINLRNFSNLFLDAKWYLTRLQFGLYNMFHGNGYSPIHLLQCMSISLHNALLCNRIGNWENLFSLYS